jgi:hypothetical protein
MDRATAWTRPLQLVTGVFWLATALLNVVVVFVIGGHLVLNFETNLTQMPSAPPGGAHDTALAYAAVQIGFTVLLVGAFTLLAWGCRKRALWAFWTSVAVLTLGGPLNILLNGLGISAALSYTPSWVETAFVVDSMTGFAVLATLLAGAVLVGPWGLRMEHSHHGAGASI